MSPAEADDTIRVTIRQDYRQVVPMCQVCDTESAVPFTIVQFVKKNWAFGVIVLHGPRILNVLE